MSLVLLQLYPNHVIPSRKARAQEVAQSDSATTYTSSTTDDVKTQGRHSNSADEGIAELDGPTTVPGLLELLKEKDERIEELGDQLLRVSNITNSSRHFSCDAFVSGVKLAWAEKLKFVSR